MQVREFCDGCEVSQALLVREAEVRARRDGGEYLKLMLGDRTGSVPAVIWDGVQQARTACIRGEVVFVTGRYSVHGRFGPQLQVASARPAREDEYAHNQLIDGPVRT